MSLALVTTALLTHATQASEPVPYAGCGLLEPGVECPRFVGDDGTTFSIPNIGKFPLGSYVLVQGTICFDCPNICQEGPVFETASIESCFKEPPAFFFSRCGTLVLDDTGQVPCVLFRTDFDEQLYTLQNIPDQFQVGDHVRVASNELVICLEPCDSTSFCLMNNTVQECGSPVDLCGTIVDYSTGPIFNCTNFISDDGIAYMIANLGPYAAGNRARVVGFVEGCTWCKMVSGCIIEHTINPCPDIDGDGAVDVSDLIAVILAWGECPKACPQDVDGDDAVDVDDLIYVILNWSA